MARRSKVRDSELVLCEDDHVGVYGREHCAVGVRVYEVIDRDGSGRCGYGRDEHGCGQYDRDVNGRDEHGCDGNDRRVDGCFYAGELPGNALSGHVRRASAHAHDARGRRRSCQ